MGRKKNDSEAERLEKENKELKSIVRSLERQIKKLHSEYKYEKEETTEVEFDDRETCTNCGKGSLETVELAGRIFKRCGTCDFRSKAQKKG